MSITTTSSKKSFFNGRKVYFVLAAIAFVIAASVIFVLLQAVTATATYYVLNKDLPARSIITQAELTAVTTSEGGQPRTALNLGDVLSSQVYTKYSLHAGDILTTSNSGALTSLNKGLPKEFVVASFKAAPSVAAGGKIQRGDYVDIFAIDPNTKGAHLFLQRALIVDATSDLDSGSSTPANASTSTDASGTTSGATPAGGKSVSAADSSAYRTGVPVLFTVGLSQTDAARLAVASKGDMYVVLSSSQSAANGASSADVGAGATDIFSGSVGDAGTGTDNTFGQSGKKTTNNPSSPSPSPSPSSSSSDPNPSSSSPSSSNLVPSPAPSPSGTSKISGNL